MNFLLYKTKKVCSSQVEVLTSFYSKCFNNKKAVGMKQMWFKKKVVRRKKNKMFFTIVCVKTSRGAISRGKLKQGRRNSRVISTYTLHVAVFLSLHAVYNMSDSFILDSMYAR